MFDEPDEITLVVRAAAQERPTRFPGTLLMLGTCRRPTGSRQTCKIVSFLGWDPQTQHEGYGSPPPPGGDPTGEELVPGSADLGYLSRRAPTLGRGAGTLTGRGRGSSIRSLATEVRVPSKIRRAGQGSRSRIRRSSAKCSVVHEDKTTGSRRPLPPPRKVLNEEILWSRVCDLEFDELRRLDDLLEERVRKPRRDRSLALLRPIEAYQRLQVRPGRRGGRLGRDQAEIEKKRLLIRQIYRLAFRAAKCCREFAKPRSMRIPDRRDHPFRRKAIADSEARRSLVPGIRRSMGWVIFLGLHEPIRVRMGPLAGITLGPIGSLRQKDRYSITKAISRALGSKHRGKRTLAFWITYELLAWLEQRGLLRPSDKPISERHLRRILAIPQLRVRT